MYPICPMQNPEGCGWWMKVYITLEKECVKVGVRSNDPIGINVGAKWTTRFVAVSHFHVSIFVLFLFVACEKPVRVEWLSVCKYVPGSQT